MSYFEPLRSGENREGGLAGQELRDRIARQNLAEAVRQSMNESGFPEVPGSYTGPVKGLRETSKTRNPDSILDPNTRRIIARQEEADRQKAENSLREEGLL